MGNLPLTHSLSEGPVAQGVPPAKGFTGTVSAESQWNGPRSRDPDSENSTDVMTMEGTLFEKDVLLG